MKQLEDNIKERLDAYESPLPDGHLSAFLAKLDGKNIPHRHSIVWVVLPSLAATIALFIFLKGNPTQTDTTAANDNMLSSQTAKIIDYEPSLDETAGLPSTQTAPSAVSFLASARHKPSQTKSAQAEPADIATASDSAHSKATVTETTVRHPATSESRPSAALSPFAKVNDWTATKRTDMKVGTAATGILSGTSALFLASYLPIAPSKSERSLIIPTIDTGRGKTSFGNQTGQPGTASDDTHILIDAPYHQNPWRTALSLRFPLSEKLSLNTGLEYLWYSSTFHVITKMDYIQAESAYLCRFGYKKQKVQYLSIPLRMDYTLAQGRRVEAYIGAGLSADFCAKATYDGKAINKDGLTCSLLGAAGVQLNITRQAGLFVEPTASYSMPFGYRVLTTYRTEHPFMFSISSGLRLTLPSINP